MTWVIERAASSTERPASEPHWRGFMRPEVEGRRKSLDAMICSRILEIVSSNTMIRNALRSEYDGVSGFGRMIPLASLRDFGWMPNSARGEMREGIMEGLMRCIAFQTPYRTWSGPGVDLFEDLANALFTSSAVTGGVFGC